MFENTPSRLTVFSSRSTISTRYALIQMEKAVWNEKTNTNVVAQVFFFFLLLCLSTTLLGKRQLKITLREKYTGRSRKRQSGAVGPSMIRSAAGENKRHSGRVLPPPFRAPVHTVCRSAAGGGSARVPARRLSPRLEVGGSLNVFQTG